MELSWCRRTTLSLLKAWNYFLSELLYLFRKHGNLGSYEFIFIALLTSQVVVHLVDRPNFGLMKSNKEGKKSERLCLPVRLEPRTSRGWGAWSPTVSKLQTLFLKPLSHSISHPSPLPTQHSPHFTKQFFSTWLLTISYFSRNRLKFTTWI